MDLKKLAGQAGQYFTRAVQYTEEKLGNAEKTEFDSHYDTLLSQADSAKLWTEKLVAGAQAVVIPNPGNRVEDMLFEKLEKRRPNRLSNLEHLGLDMVQAGTEFGAGTAYGSALLKVGGAEQRVGLAERDYVGSTMTDFMEPLQKFLDTEIKTIARERRILDNRRLDLDAAKSRLRKARSLDAQQAAESELRKCQAEFDRQTEITKLLLEGVRSTQASHLKHLQAYVAAQAAYHQAAHNIMTELKADLESAAGAPPSPLPYSPTAPPACSPPTAGRRARVVCDYDATSPLDLSLMVNEFSLVSRSCCVTPLTLKVGLACPLDCKTEAWYSHTLIFAPQSQITKFSCYFGEPRLMQPRLQEVMFEHIEGCSDFVQVSRAGRSGRVPRAYLEMLDD
ncbi:BAR domain [Trinorchestia longiramus]|nr:BAR domain [Trinorchestia longiramus]